ncbi:DUF4817 domain-containing protein [Trichonephila clavipes]|nr:DUF4817 domain-containing protein [Trichonephila clavipes]
MSFLSLISVTLPERALLVKLFYESKGNAAAALREFRRLKNLRKGPLLPQALKRMIARFEKTGHLGVQPGRGRKSTRSDVVEDVATAIVDKSMDNVIGCSSARAVSRHLGVPYSTVWNWGYLKNLVYGGRLITLADLKGSITLHVRSISVDQLRSAVEQTLHRLQILHLEEGNHIEQHSLHR